MRDSHRVEAERLLARAVEEEVRRSGGRTDGKLIGVARGEAWARLELAVVDGANARTAQALGLCDEADEYVGAYRLPLERGVSLEAGRQAWRLGMVPSRHAREVMGVAVPAAR